MVGGPENPIGGGPIGGGPIGPWPDDDGGAVLYEQDITANVDVALTAYSFLVGKFVVPVCDLSVTIPRAITFTRRIDCDVSAPFTKAVRVTLASALADVTSTVTKQAGKIILTGVDGALTAYSFVVGKLVVPVCDAAVTIPRAITFTRRIDCDVSAPFTKAVSVTLASALADLSATVTKQVGKIVLAGVDVAVAAYSFVVGKLVVPLCDLSVTVVKGVTRTLTAASVTVAAAVNTVANFIRRIFSVLYY
jgi:hypothetical protein